MDAVAVSCVAGAEAVGLLLVDPVAPLSSSSPPLSAIARPPTTTAIRTTAPMTIAATFAPPPLRGGCGG